MCCLGTQTRKQSGNIQSIMMFLQCFPNASSFALPCNVFRSYIICVLKAENVFEILRHGHSSASSTMFPRLPPPPLNIQGGHIFVLLNSLSFPEIFRVFSNFSLRITTEKSSLEYIFIDDYVAYFTFSLSFPGFSKKFKFPWVFPEILTIFQISWDFHVFQVCGHPDISKKIGTLCAQRSFPRHYLQPPPPQKKNHQQLEVLDRIVL